MCLQCRTWLRIICINITFTRKHSSMMCTARSLPCRGRGVSLTETPWIEPPLDRDPLGQRPPTNRDSPTDRDPPTDREPPGQRPPGQTSPWTEIPPVNRITDRCKNITFPQLRLRAVKNTRSV